MERTLIIAKPDSVRRGLVGEIISRFENRGYKIVDIKSMNISDTLAEQHYIEHKGKGFFGELVEFITSGKVVAFVIEGPNAVEAARLTIGATDPSKATPGTIRGDYANSIASNLIHASDSLKSAEREIALFFGKH